MSKRDHKASEQEWRTGAGRPQVETHAREGWSVKVGPVLVWLLTAIVIGVSFREAWMVWG